MAEDNEARDQADDTWMMAQEAGLRVDLDQIQRLPSKKREIARRMLQRGKTDDLSIEPFFLRLIAEHDGFTATETELNDLSAKERVQLLERLDHERGARRLARHVRRWAWHIVVVLLLIYPFIGAYFVWRLTAAPLYNKDILSVFSDKQPGETGIPDIIISFGPAALSFIAVAYLVTFLAHILRPRDY